MAHFAQLDNNNKVLRVLVVNNEEIIDENGQESEQKGAEFLNSLIGGRWIQTSYNGNFRGKYAAEDDIYDENNDIFIGQE